MPFEQQKFFKKPPETPETGEEKKMSFWEAIGDKDVLQKIREQLNESPFSEKAKNWIDEAVSEYFRENKQRELERLWRAGMPGERGEEERRKVQVYRGECAPDEVREIRKIVGALQDSIIALGKGDPEKFNKKIAGRLVERFKELEREARENKEEERAEIYARVAEEYRDLQGFLLKEQRTRELKER